MYSEKNFVFYIVSNKYTKFTLLSQTVASITFPYELPTLSWITKAFTHEKTLPSEVACDAILFNKVVYKNFFSTFNQVCAFSKARLSAHSI